jgi:hypothetical protein
LLPNGMSHLEMFRLPRLNSRLQYFPVVLIVSMFAIASSLRRFFGDDFCAYSARFFADGCLGISPIQEQAVLTTSIQQARSQDRFYQVIYYSITQIVLASEALTIFAKILMTVAICFLVFRIGSWFLGVRLGLFSVVLFVATYPLLGYNTLTNLPGWFNLGAVAFLVFLDQFLRIFLDGARISRLSVALFYAGFLVSLFSYEMYVGISVALLLLIGMQRSHLKKRTGASWSANQLRHYWILGLFILLYLAAYLTFMLSSAGTYGGTDVTTLSPIAITSTLTLLSLGAIPLSLFSGIHTIVKEPAGIEITGLVSIGSISWTVLLAAIVFTLLILFSLTLLSTDVSKSVMSGFCWIVLISLIFLPNLLLSLTQRYRDWSLAYPFYLTTLNSHSFLCIFLVAVASKFILVSRFSKVVCMLIFIPLLVLSSLSKASYFSESLQFNGRLHALEIRARDNASGKSLNYREVDKEIGAFPYRFAEAYLNRR